jgi:hypothetical protein
MDTHSFDETPETRGFAEGWTCFLTVAGLDVLLRNAAGESKGRLSEIDEENNLTGSMYEPGAAEDAKPIEITVTPRSNEHLTLRCNGRVWELRKPPGKAHFFAFLNQWPAKAEPVGSVKAMLALLRKPKA